MFLHSSDTAGIDADNVLGWSTCSSHAARIGNSVSIFVQESRQDQASLSPGRRAGTKEVAGESAI